MTEQSFSDSVENTHPTETALPADFSPYKDALAAGAKLSPEHYLRKYHVPSESHEQFRQKIVESDEYQAAEAMSRIVDQSYAEIDDLITDLRIIGDRPLKLEGFDEDETAGTLTGDNTADALEKLKARWPQFREKLNGGDDSLANYNKVESFLGQKGITRSHDIRGLVWKLLDSQAA